MTPRKLDLASFAALALSRAASSSAIRWAWWSWKAFSLASRSMVMVTSTNRPAATNGIEDTMGQNIGPPQFDAIRMAATTPYGEEITIACLGELRSWAKTST